MIENNNTKNDESNSFNDSFKMKLPKAYEGDEPFIFISYRHLDNHKVFPIIKKMQDEFYRVWYDDGIKAGSDWNYYIENHLRKASVFIAFFSKSYFKSEYCIKELEMARELGISFTYVKVRLVDKILNIDVNGNEFEE